MVTTTPEANEHTHMVQGKRGAHELDFHSVDMNGVRGETVKKQKNEDGGAVAVVLDQVGQLNGHSPLSQGGTMLANRERRERKENKRLRDLGEGIPEPKSAARVQQPIDENAMKTGTLRETQADLQPLIDEARSCSTLDEVYKMIHRLIPSRRGNTPHARLLRETYKALQLGSFTNRKDAIPCIGNMIWLLAGKEGEEAQVDAARAVDPPHLPQSMKYLVMDSSSRFTGQMVLDKHFGVPSGYGKSSAKKTGGFVDNFSADMRRLAEIGKQVLGVKQGDRVTVDMVFQSQLLANYDIRCVTMTGSPAKEGIVNEEGTGIICKCRECNKKPSIKHLKPHEFLVHGTGNDSDLVNRIKLKMNGHTLGEMLALIESDEISAEADIYPDFCYHCRKGGGELLCCEGCISCWHFACAGLSSPPAQEQSWFCIKCVEEGKLTQPVGKGKGIREAGRGKESKKKQTKGKGKGKGTGGYKPKTGQRLTMKAPQRHSGRPVRNLNRNKRLFEGEEGGLTNGMRVHYVARSQKILGGYIVINPAGKSGILCDHCQQIISCSQFESHAGHAQRRQPYEHIYVESEGVNLKKIAARLPERSTGGDGHDDDGPVDIYSDLDALAGGCTFCREPDFQKGEFGPRTIMICDQCEREYHVGCLEKHGLAKLESLPEGDWFCDPACGRIHAHFRALVHSGEMKADILLQSRNEDDRKEDHVGDALNSGRYVEVAENDNSTENLKRRSSRTCVIAPKPMIKDSPYKHDIEDYTWQILNGQDGTEETKVAIEEATKLLQESFDPIMDLSTNTDLLPLMIHAEQYSDWDYRGVHTILLKYNSIPVVAAIVRVFGPQMAELPLIATLKSQRRQGHAKVLVDLFQRHLYEAGVHRLVLPAAHETVVTWKNGFKFIDMPPEEVRLAKHQLKVLVFPGTEMLWKTIEGIQPPIGHHILKPIISEEDANQLIGVVRNMVMLITKEFEVEEKASIQTKFMVDEQSGHVNVSLTVHRPES